MSNRELNELIGEMLIEAQKHQAEREALALAAARLQRHAVGVQAIVEEMTSALTRISPNGTILD